MDPIVDKTINGTHGQIWVDGSLIAEVQTFTSQIEIQYEDVPVAGKGANHRKQVGWTGTGAMNVNKVYSRQVNKLANSIKAGRTVRSTIVGKLADPDADGTERVTLRDVTFDGLQLLNFEQKTVVKEDMAYQFSDYDIVDTIPTP